jgi:hypothetical protein
MMKALPIAALVLAMLTVARIGYAQTPPFFSSEPGVPGSPITMPFNGTVDSTNDYAGIASENRRREPARPATTSAGRNRKMRP